MRGINRLFLALSVFLVLLGGMAAAFEEEELEVYDVVEDVNSNFYEFLELKADASSSDIRKAYRRLSLSLHPDKGRAKKSNKTIFDWKGISGYSSVKSSIANTTTIHLRYVL